MHPASGALRDPCGERTDELGTLTFAAAHVDGKTDDQLRGRPWSDLLADGFFEVIEQLLTFADCDRGFEHRQGCNESCHGIADGEAGALVPKIKSDVPHAGV